LIVIDTNVLIRYVTDDHPDHSQRAFDLLRKFQTGERSGMLLEGVIIETVQVLSSKDLYNIGREEIRARVGGVLRLAGIRTPAKQVFLRALDIYNEVPRLSFVDSLCVAYAERDHPSVVVSFDREFRRVPSITWEQP
jgi:predicted nucleic acid-binding protein